MPLSEEQTAVLLRPIAQHRVHKTPEGFSHVEAFDIRAMLNRIFGFAGWSLEETTPATCVVETAYELKSGKPGVKVAKSGSESNCGTSLCWDISHPPCALVARPSVRSRWRWRTSRPSSPCPAAPSTHPPIDGLLGSSLSKRMAYAKAAEIATSLGLPPRLPVEHVRRWGAGEVTHLGPEWTRDAPG